MNCHRHPNKRVVASCRDCGTGFCIECVRETDQTTLCPECYRRKVSEIARELAPEPEQTVAEKPPEMPGKVAEHVRAPVVPQAAVPREPAPSLDEKTPTEKTPLEAGVAPPPVARKAPRLRPSKRTFILPGRRKKAETVLPGKETRTVREESPEAIREETEEIIKELEQAEAIEVVEEKIEEVSREEVREELPELARKEVEKTRGEELGEISAPVIEVVEEIEVEEEDLPQEELEVALEVLEEEAREAAIAEEHEEFPELVHEAAEVDIGAVENLQPPSALIEEAEEDIPKEEREEALEVLEEEAREAAIAEEHEEFPELVHEAEAEVVSAGESLQVPSALIEEAGEGITEEGLETALEIVGKEIKEKIEEAHEEVREKPQEPVREEAKEEARGRKGKEEGEEEAGDFLAQGPDEDFSQLATERPRFRLGRRRERATAAEEASPADREATATPVGERPSRSSRLRAAGPRAARRAPRQGSTSEDLLLEDVVATLLKPEGEAGSGGMATSLPGTTQTSFPGAAAATAAAAGAAVALPGTAGARRRRREERDERREERRERWAFIAQGRSAEHTIIAASWWRAAVFIALMLLLGAVLWAVPNAYLVPKDTEYGIHAVAIGVMLGLFFWWKAGRKHGTKLAVQAALVTFFSLAVGEFLHWFLIITKNAAFRTILFDLVSFRFLWENGAEIMRYTMEAMFPGAFVWILILPSVMAFVIGFGMPPIPEVFFQFGHAMRKQAKGK